MTWADDMPDPVRITLRTGVVETTGHAVPEVRIKVPEKEHETDPRPDCMQLVEKISVRVSTGGAVSSEAAVAMKIKERTRTRSDNITLNKPRLRAYTARVFDNGRQLFQQCRRTNT